MDILVFACENLARVTRFQNVARERGWCAHHVKPGAPMPDVLALVSGAVLFDDSHHDFTATVRITREQIRFLSIPLLLVTKRSLPEMEGYEGCAECSFIADSSSDEAILEVLESRPTVAPVKQPQLADALVTAVRQTLAEMAGFDPIVCSVYQRSSPAPLGDVSAVIRVSAEHKSLFILTYSQTAATAIARRILLDVPSNLDSVLILDCMGEVANVAAGQAKALLVGTPGHFIFATPSVLTGDQKGELTQEMDSLVIAFDSELGTFALQLCAIPDKNVLP